MNTTFEYFDTLSEGWTRKYQQSIHFQERLEMVLAWLLRKIPPDASKKPHVLDYGCGSGVFVKALLEKNYQVTGVDPSFAMIAEAKKLLSDYPSDKFHLECILPGTTSFTCPEAGFDCIILMGVLEYVDTPDILLPALSHLLKPGGHFIVSVPNQKSILRQLEAFIYQYRFLFRFLPGFKHLTGRDSYLHFQKHQWSFKEINHLLAQAGLESSGFYFHVAPTGLKRLAALPFVGMTLILDCQKSLLPSS